MNHDHQTGIYGTVAFGSGWWIVDAVTRYGPSWQLVPPILLGVASLIASVSGWLDKRQARRHAELKFRAEMARKRPFLPGLESLN